MRVITPLEIPETKADRVLINVHGGGFNSDSGSLTETIPVAYLTHTKVVAVLGPEKGFPLIEQTKGVSGYVVRKTDKGDESFGSKQFPQVRQRDEK